MLRSVSSDCCEHIPRCVLFVLCPNISHAGCVCTSSRGSQGCASLSDTSRSDPYRHTVDMIRYGSGRKRFKMERRVLKWISIKSGLHIRTLNGSPVTKRLSFHSILFFLFLRCSLKLLRRCCGIHYMTVINDIVTYYLHKVAEIKQIKFQI